MTTCNNSSLFPNPPCSGDIVPLTLTFTENGQPYSLVGATVGMTIKIAPSTVNDADAIYTKDVAGDATGIINFLVGPLPTGTYWLDVKMWNGTGMRTTVIQPSKFSVVQSVTLR